MYLGSICPVHAFHNTPIIGKYSSSLHAIWTFLYAHASPQKKLRNAIYANAPSGHTSTDSIFLGALSISITNVLTLPKLILVPSMSIYSCTTSANTSIQPTILVPLEHAAIIPAAMYFFSKRK